MLLTCCLANILILVDGAAGWRVSSPNVSDLLNRYGANQEKTQSWTLKCEVTSEFLGERTKGRVPRAGRDCDLRWDGMRVSSRCSKWTEAASGPTLGGRRMYLSLTWDGNRYITYRCSDPNKPGRVYISDMLGMDPKQKQWEIESLQYDHPAAVLMGFYPGALKRVDTILRDAQSVSIRDSLDAIHGSLCYVMDANTVCGKYTLWIDPEQGYNIAQIRIARSRDKGHLYYDKPFRAKSSSFVLENVRFEQVQGAWVAMEADYTTQTEEDGPRAGVSSVKAHVRISEISLSPDHDTLRSFTGGDIPNGAEVFVVPVTHIRYNWTDGELVTKIDEDAVRQIDEIVDSLGAEKEGLQTGESTDVPVESPAQDREPAKDMDRVNPRALILPRPYCGVYCLYSALRLLGQDVDFRDLVTPQYVGSAQGSTMAELGKAAKDNGLFAGVGARLTIRGLSRCPYPAILHVKADFSHRDYDHYELFLGTEDGQAKLFDPPRTPRLVPFRELAARWDGYALVLSDSPFVVDSIFGPDRQRLLMWAGLGTVVLFLVHLLRSHLSIPRRCATRRWRMGLSVGQAVALGIMALASGVVYHVGGREGLVANAQATALFRKAYQGTFIPKIGVHQVRKLLDTETIVIDARYAEDYQSGHLKGAISLPIDSNDVNWHKITTPIPKDSPTMVYCQSAGCKFAERVASQLVEDGFADIRIFRGGWAEWSAKSGDPTKNGMRKQDGVEPNGTVHEPADAASD